ncbi:MAG: CoA transferase [Bacteroidia bacterium]|nr:CoA transferase [Bacteroidia bacterium]
MASARELITSLPRRLKADRAAGVSLRLHLDLSGPEGGQWTVSVEAQACGVQEGLHGLPGCTLRARAEHYAALELGELNPQMALLSGKLKVDGIAQLMAFTKLFRRYRPEAEAPAAPGIRRKPQQGPLLGLRILDLTRLLPGPLATQMLADMGAEVIKIEHPDSPDYVRDAPPQQGGISAYFLALNRSKRSIFLPYGSPEGNRAFLDLVRSADAVVEQFRPGVLEQAGIGYAAAAAVNPRICYVSLTGYGQSGPYSSLAGHDLNYLAYSGLLARNRDASGRPVIPGVQLADIASGSYLTVSAVLAALLGAKASGQGQHVDVSMAEGMLPLHALAYAELGAGASVPPNGQGLLSGGLVNYRVYPTQDGKWVALGALEPKFWEAFCDAAGKPEWKPGIVPEQAAQMGLAAQVEALFRSQPRAYWAHLGQTADCCLSPVLELEELDQDSHLVERNAFIVQQHPEAGEVRGIATPIRFSRTPAQAQWPASASPVDLVEP